MDPQISSIKSYREFLDINQILLNEFQFVRSDCSPGNQFNRETQQLLNVLGQCYKFKTH